MVDHLVFYVIHPRWYIVVDHPCVELFFVSLPPISSALSEKAPLSLSVYLIPRDNHISVYRTKIHWEVAKFAHLFSLCQFFRWPLDIQYILLARAVTTVTSHYSHSSTNILYVVYESNWLENAHKWANYRKFIWWIRIWMY